MTLHRASGVALAALLLAATGQAADEPGTITATGTATRASWPRVMRVTIVLREEADDGPGALAQLASSRERLTAALASAGLPADSVAMLRLALGEPTDEQSRMHQMVRMQMGEQAKASEPAATIVSAALTADVPIEGDGPEEAIVRVEALRRKLEASLAVPEVGMTPEELEAREEMDLYLEAYSQQAAALPGVPQFRFVAVFDEAAQAIAIAEAFGRARTAAESLAKAVGGTLGSIREVSSAAIAGEWPEEQYAAYLNALGAKPVPGSGGREVMVPQFTEATLTISVTAKFAIR